MLLLLFSGGSGPAPPLFSGTIPDISESQNTGTHQYDLSSYFGGATSYSIDPALEAGWSFDTGTAVLEIDTDALGTFGPYIITATNGAGSDDSNAFGVSVVEAIVSDQVTGGGWAFLNSYQAELNRRKRRKKELEELEEEVEKIEVKLDRDIAKLLHEQEAKDERQRDMARLHAMAKVEQDLKAAQELGDRVAIAYARALRQGNYSALEALDRELKRAIEEEEFLLEAARMFFD